MINELIFDIISENQGCEYYYIYNNFYNHAIKHPMEYEFYKLNKFYINKLISENKIKMAKIDNIEKYYYNLTETEINLLIIEL